MVSKEQKKIDRVINFMKKGLSSLSDDLEETVKGINDFIKSLAKAQKDLKDVTVEEEVVTVSTSSKKVVAPVSSNAKTKAASTLFSLLSGSPKTGAPAPTTAASSTISAPPVISKPPSAPSGGAPPKAPTSGGPPSRSGLPPAPKLPPAPSSGGAPPSGPPSAPSSFAKRPTPPKAPSTTGPPSPPGAPSSVAAGPPAAPSLAPKAGGGLSSLRDEMLDELNRLKKIMRGE
jgi:hypothetical protein